MKSAYELALERLEKTSGPTRKLNEEQKARIADIDKKYEARIAEEKLSIDTKVATAPPEQIDQLKQEQAERIASLEEKRNREKDAIWDES